MVNGKRTTSGPVSKTAVGRRTSTGTTAAKKKVQPSGNAVVKKGAGKATAQAQAQALVSATAMVGGRKEGTAVGTRSSAGGAGKANGKAVSAKKAKGTAPASKKRRIEERDEDAMDIDEEDDDQVESDKENDSDPEGALTDPKQPILRARSRKVPLHVVDDKWTDLPNPAIKDITGLLTGIEKTVLNTFTSERRKTEAQTELGRIMKRLIAQLPRIPVPKMPIKELGFNLERLHEQNRQMESTIRPDLEQIGMLEADIDNTKRLIKLRQAQLDELRVNAEDQARLQRQRIGNLHPTLRTPLNPTESQFSAERINLAPPQLPMDTTYDPSNDPEILTLKHSLQSHLSSIVANTAPMEGFVDRIREVRGTVDEVLGRMGGGVMERVMEV